jgi:hypothetical protein
MSTRCRPRWEEQHDEPDEVEGSDFICAATRTTIAPSAMTMKL